MENKVFHKTGSVIHTALLCCLLIRGTVVSLRIIVLVVLSASPVYEAYWYTALAFEHVAYIILIIFSTSRPGMLLAQLYYVVLFLLLLCKLCHHLCEQICEHCNATAYFFMQIDRR